MFSTSDLSENTQSWLLIQKKAVMGRFVRHIRVLKETANGVSMLEIGIRVADRVMFGSDQMRWPEKIGVGIENHRTSSFPLGE